MSAPGRGLGNEQPRRGPKVCVVKNHGCARILPISPQDKVHACSSVFLDVDTKIDATHCIDYTLS